MKIYCVRIGDKYGPEYEDYLKKKLSKYDLHFIREAYDPRIKLQWNKMLPMSFDDEEPVVVMDIDVLLIHDYEKVFDYPIKRGEFVALPGWWNPDMDNFNGGFFKYFPKDCNYIFETFMSDPVKWQKHYIELGLTKGPVNGEQNFVHEHVIKNLKLVSPPKEWFVRWTTTKMHFKNAYEDEYTAALKWEQYITEQYKDHTGNSYIFDGNDFHEDIKFVHFTHMLNKPHEWELIGKFYGTD